MVRDIVSRSIAVAAIDTVPTAIPTSVAITDIDGFGILNEEHGRSVGDAVLTGIDQAIERNLPADAQIHRVGGDEWIIALPGRPVENCLVLFEELRAHIATTPFGDADHHCTLSIGVCGRPPHGTTGEELVRGADSALSRSKRGGRNRVGIYVEDKMVMKSNYYSRATLDRLASLSRATNRTEASLLREAAEHLLDQYADMI